MALWQGSSRGEIMHADPTGPLIEDGFLDQLEAGLAAALERAAQEEERLVVVAEEALEAAPGSAAWQRTLLSLSERLDAWQRGLAALTDEVANVEAELMRHQNALRDWVGRSAALTARTQELRPQGRKAA
jgi:chromosome segregation ATPase